MRLYFAVLSVALLLLGADFAEEDTKHMQGPWDVVSFHLGGKEVPAEDIKAMKVVFEADQMTIKSKRGDEKGRVDLDTTKKPKAFDLFPEKGKEAARFIYELDGDSLKLCWRMPGGKRPEEFAPDSTVALLVLSRSK